MEHSASETHPRLSHMQQQCPVRSCQRQCSWKSWLTSDWHWLQILEHDVIICDHIQRISTSFFWIITGLLTYTVLILQCYCKLSLNYTMCGQHKSQQATATCCRQIWLYDDWYGNITKSNQIKSSSTGKCWNYVSRVFEKNNHSIRSLSLSPSILRHVTAIAGLAHSCSHTRVIL